MRSVRLSRSRSARLRGRPIVLVTSVVAVLGLTLLPGGGAQAAPTLSAAEKQLDALGVKMDATNEKLNTARIQLSRVKKQQAGLKKQLDAADKRLDASQGEVGKIAASAYRDGGITMSGSLVTSGSPQSFLDQMSTLDWLSLQQKGTIDRARRDKTSYDTAKAKVDSQTKAAATLEKTLSSQKTGLKKDQAKWEQIRRSAYITKYGTAPAGSVISYNGQASGNAAVVVKYALAQQGKPYVFGADGPDSFDCSGLSMAAWSQVGVSLPHSAHLQYEQIQHVSRANLQPGDIVFFYSDIHHDGIYIGNNQVVHAPTEGESVKVSSMDVFPFYGAGRP